MYTYIYGFLRYRNNGCARISCQVGSGPTFRTAHVTPMQRAFTAADTASGELIKTCCSTRVPLRTRTHYSAMALEAIVEHIVISETMREPVTCSLSCPLRAVGCSSTFDILVRRSMLSRSSAERQRESARLLNDSAHRSSLKGTPPENLVKPGRL